MHTIEMLQKYHKALLDRINIQMQTIRLRGIFALWNDANAKYCCWFEFLNICGIFMTCVCLLFLAKLKTLFQKCPYNCMVTMITVDIHCHEEMTVDGRLWPVTIAAWRKVKI